MTNEPSSYSADSLTAPSRDGHSFPCSSSAPCNNHCHFSRIWDQLHGPIRLGLGNDMRFWSQIQIYLTGQFSSFFGCESQKIFLSLYPTSQHQKILCTFCSCLPPQLVEIHHSREVKENRTCSSFRVWMLLPVVVSSPPIHSLFYTVNRCCVGCLHRGPCNCSFLIWKGLVVTVHKSNSINQQGSSISYIRYCDFFAFCCRFLIPFSLCLCFRLLIPDSKPSCDKSHEGCSQELAICL